MLNHKTKATGRRVMGKNLLKQYKEVAIELKENQREGVKPAESLDSLIYFFKGMKEVAEKKILVLEKVKEQQIDFETFLEQTQKIKEEIYYEEVTDAN